MKMILNMVRYGRRQLHTIISREIIKPSSPTPSHLKTYNLSIYDQTFSRQAFMPMIMFYPNPGNHHTSSHDKTVELKNSLSHTLAKYYPFSGRYGKVASAYVDCNDNGAEFFKANVDTTLSHFLQTSQYEDLNQFFPHALNYSSDHHLQNDEVIPLMVQVNHFVCGGVAVAVSMTHKIADGTSLTRFIDDWAKMTRLCSKYQKQEFPINPEFISHEYKNINCMGLSLQRSNDCVTRSFMFPNIKINNLKLKVKGMIKESGKPMITNLTRVEVLVWLMYKCAVAAATKNSISGSFKPTRVCHTINIRSKMMEQLPEKCVGNFFLLLDIPTKNEIELKPETFISELKKKKLQIQGLRNIDDAFSVISKAYLEELQSNFDSGYTFSSLCGYPTYEIDFGWGKPVKVTMPGYTSKNHVVFMDAPNSYGIEAIVCLGKQDMDIFQSDPELLAFC